MYPVNYKDYPEYMIVAYLPSREGDDLRRVAGSVVFKSIDSHGYTYKNGVLHSYNDLPASVDNGVHTWYLDGKIHRDGDRPAVLNGSKQAWYQNSRLHREGDLQALIDGEYREYWCRGERIKIMVEK